MIMLNLSIKLCIKSHIFMIKQVRNLADFIEKSNDIHKFKYIYIKSIYVGCQGLLIITCPVKGHGDFPQTASCHLSGRGCPKCAGVYKHTTEEFIKLANEIHENKYTYLKCIYLGSLKKCIITCKIHGDFKQRPNSHLRGKGCKDCSNDARRGNFQNFINNANIIHNFKYDYSLFEYKTYKIKGVIICHEKDIHGEEHGNFPQNASSHLKGKGCPKCAKEANGLYSLSFFKKNPNVKNNLGILYIIKFTNNETEFYKIGMTKNTIMKRFQVELQLYKITELFIYKNKLFEIFKLEQKFLKIVRSTQIRPRNTNLAGGESECFYADEKFINDLIIKVNNKTNNLKN